MSRKSIVGIIALMMVLPAGATKISNVNVDMIKGYGAVMVNGAQVNSYMGRLTYTFLAETNDSVFVDFSVALQGSQDAIPIVEKVGAVGIVKQANAGDTLKTVYFRAKITGDATGTYVATVTADANMSQMWKLADTLAKQMTPAQKQSLFFASTNSKVLENFGSDDITVGNTLLVGWRCSDGPHGVRWPLGPKNDIAIYGAGDTMTLFPTEAALGCTWDTAMTRRVGQAIGQESRAMGLYCNLGPMCDLVINPRWGRAFETMGEDPFLNGKMVANQIRGLQSEHVIATPKHYGPYIKENGRWGLLVIVSERALRELFSVPFEMALTEGGARALMTCYNQVRVPGFTSSDPAVIAGGGEQAGTNRHTIQDIVRNDWGFDGIIMTDWNGAFGANEAYVYNTEFDMSMPVGYGLLNVGTNVGSGAWSPDPATRKAKRIIHDRLWAWGGQLLTSDAQINTYTKSIILSPDHKQTSIDAAHESIVLAKNDPVAGSPILPLSKTATMKIAVVGPYSTVGRQGGGGSSAVTPDSMISPLQGIQKLCAAYPNVTVNQDYTTADVAVVCVGVDAESEDLDRPSYVLPAIAGVDQNAQVATIMAKVPKTIVVYTGGSASCAGSWSSAPAVVIAFYPGRSQGRALADILFGDVNPSGHLNVCFPQTIGDLPSYDATNNAITLNSADTAHGYFYYEKMNKKPLFWFGHGLSYTNFYYTAINIAGSTTVTAGDRVDVSVDVQNIGTRAGDDVIQLYVKPSNNTTRRVKDLRGFARVSLAAGNGTAVTFTLGPRDFSVYTPNAATQTGQWTVVPGSYDIIAASTSNPAELVTGTGKCVSTTITIQ
jgi:beta-glucosidase